LTPTIEEQIKNTIAEAMAMAHAEQKVIIEDTIKVVVNGKIDKLQIHMSEQDVKLTEINTEQIRVKNELKSLRENTDPLVNIRSVVLSFGKFIMWIGGIILILASIYKLIAK